MTQLEANSLVSIRDVLRAIWELPWNTFLYAERKDIIDLETICAIIDLDNEEDPDNPVFAQANKLVYILSVSSIQDIVTNVQLQRPDATLEIFVVALNYYLDHDAFLVLEKTD